MVKGITWPAAAAGALTQHARTASNVLLLCLAVAAAAPMAALAAPYLSAPAAVPGTIQAERFDRGGEGPGYHEFSAANTGGAFRTTEGVDIRADVSAPGSNFIVTNIETNEWMAYTIDVAASGSYGWGVRASSAYTGSSYYFQIDGKNMTGPVTVPNTGNWDVFKWVPAPNVYLTQGRHVLKVEASAQYFDLDLIVIYALPAPAAKGAGVEFSCMFNTALPDCNFVEQAKVPGRASLTTISREGGKALRLHTEPGDTNVNNSGAMERDDVYLAKPGTADPETYGEGVEQWWAHSMLFPSDFNVPTTQAYTVLDFHSTGSAFQAPFNLAFQVQADITKPALLTFIGYGGTNAFSAAGRFDAIIGALQKNVWYDFVYHVRWSSGSDGFFYAWVNGKSVLVHNGPTMFAGQNVYLKLANYHGPVCDRTPGCVGSQPTSVIHDRIIRGTSAQAVAVGPLE